MYLSTSTSTEDFPEMYWSTFQVLYKLYLSTDVLKYKVLLPCSGVNNLLVFHSTASTVINLVATDDDDATEAVIDKLATKITQESKHLNGMSGRYETRIDLDVALGQSSSTLNSLLSRISHKLHRTCPGTLIGNMITNVIRNRPTTLQTALGVLLSRKTIIERMFDFRVCCSYDEVQRFKSSAAKASINHIEGRWRMFPVDLSRWLRITLMQTLHHKMDSYQPILWPCC